MTDGYIQIGDLGFKNPKTGKYDRTVPLYIRGEESQWLSEQRGKAISEEVDRVMAAHGFERRKEDNDVVAVPQRRQD